MFVQGIDKARIAPTDKKDGGTTPLGRVAYSSATPFRPSGGVPSSLLIIVTYGWFLAHRSVEPDSSSFDAEPGLLPGLLCGENYPYLTFLDIDTALSP